MGWDFETEPEFQEKLDWMDAFVRDEIEPIDALWGDEVYDRPMNPAVAKIIEPLKKRVQRAGALGQPSRSGARGPGLRPAEAGADERDPRALVVGVPSIFGTQAPDTGNAEIIAHYGTEEQKAQYLQPAARRRDLLELLDDRAPGRGGPHGVHHPGRARR